MESHRQVPWVVFEIATAMVVVVGLCVWLLSWVPMDRAVRAVARPVEECDTMKVVVAGGGVAVPVSAQFSRVQSVKMAIVLRQARLEAGGVPDAGKLIQLQRLMRALLKVNKESARVVVEALCQPDMPANTYAVRCRWVWVRNALTARASLVPTQTDEVMAISAALLLMESGPQGQPWLDRLAELRPDLASMIEEQR